MKLKKKLDSMVKEGWLISQAHPTLDLTIYNYSQKTQYQKYWTEETLMARGLVLNSKGKIVARPFPKFFNASEVEDQIPNTEFEVYEKEDGSLGIFFWYAVGEELHPVFASRGSFTSEQAVRGWEILQRFPYHNLAYGYTHMFEIIYPENKIVVDYNRIETVILLGIIQTATGREINRDSLEEHLGKDFHLVKKYSCNNSWKELQRHSIHNREGYVIRYLNGFRIKVKFEEYVRLHKIYSGISNIDIWEILKDGKSLSNFLENIPDELYDWVNYWEKELIKSFESNRDKAIGQFHDLEKTELIDRKSKAIWIQRNVDLEFRSILFLMLDDKNWNPLIWKMIKPLRETPQKTNFEKLAYNNQVA